MESSSYSVGFREKGKYGGEAISRVGFDDDILRAGLHGGEGMGKGLGGCLGEGGEGVRPNRPTDGDGRWKGVGEVGGVGQQEVGQGLAVWVSLRGLMEMTSVVRMSSTVLETRGER